MVPLTSFYVDRFSLDLARGHISGGSIHPGLEAGSGRWAVFGVTASVPAQRLGQGCRKLLR